MSGGEINAVPEAALGEPIAGYRGHGSTERTGIAQDSSNVAIGAKKFFDEGWGSAGLPPLPPRAEVDI